MLCEKCGKNTATTHIKTVINGKVTEQNLCGYCAAKGGYSGFNGGSISGILSSMLGKALQSETMISSRRCECCNTAFTDIAETGKVGCSNCYKEFGNELKPYLKRIHGSVHHIGKNPGTTELIVTGKENTISALKSKLATLVAEERYEEAALVRDEIKRLEGEE
jgi:protein arginine kinase activator